MEFLSSDNPIRVLEVVGRMNRAGTETWLMRVLENIDRKACHMDFLVHTDEPGAFDERIRALGSRVIPCFGQSNPIAYARNFKKIIRECGPYDIVHSHLHHFSGFVLKLAKEAGVPVRIAHSHNDTSVAESDAGLARRIYMKTMLRWIKENYTAGFAVSKTAARDLFGQEWEQDSCHRLISTGMDPAPFRINYDSAMARAELGIPSGAYVIGHVGRFEHQKNHTFLLDIVAEASRRDATICALMIGDGPLRQAIQEKVSRYGLRDRVIFAGVRADVIRLMKSAMDAFVFPSVHEGLGLVLIEAQAAGLPCIISDNIPDEADAIKALVHRMSQRQAANEWAECVLRVRNQQPPMSKEEALHIIESSCFNICTGARQLLDAYADAIKAVGVQQRQLLEVSG